MWLYCALKNLTHVLSLCFDKSCHFEHCTTSTSFNWLETWLDLAPKQLCIKLHLASSNVRRLQNWCICGPSGKKERKSDCGEWQWSVCVANEGDCGLGTREGTRTGTDCKQTIKTQRCKIPCNWKKKFGGKGRLFRLGGNMEIGAMWAGRKSLL